MIHQINQVKEFYSKFNIAIPNHQEGECLDVKGVAMRTKLAQEELQETHDAMMIEDRVGILDGLADQLYILLGTIIENGMEDVIVEAFNEVHRSNMSKLGEDGKPVLRDDGKILKGNNYSPPDLSKILYGSKK
jgi:hypothetical protein